MREKHCWLKAAEAEWAAVVVLLARKFQHQLNFRKNNVISS